MSMQGAIRPRTFKKGESLFSPGGAKDKVYLLQSGLVSISARQSDQEVVLGQAVAPQLIGEHALMGHNSWSLSAVAVNDTEALEVSVQVAQALMDSFPGPLKLLVKSLFNKQNALFSEVAMAKVKASELLPCPETAITRLFAVIYHAAISTGKSKNGVLTVVWPAFRKYCHWGMSESPVRLEQAMHLLAKLDMARLEMVQSETDPDAPLELGYVHFSDIESVGKFYRYYFDHQAEGLEGLIESASASADPDLIKHASILKAIQAWNETGTTIEVMV